MSEEKEEELLDFLASIGFKRDQMQGQVKALESSAELTAVLKYSERFGKETMFFDLHMHLDHQFNAYRLDRYKATHRDEVPVMHAVINDVDTRHLETRMAMEDWSAYFNGDHSLLNAHDKVYIGETLTLLNKLPQGQNFDGLQAQESLMFKYWPSECYDHPSKSEFQMVYEKSKNFVPNNSGTGNVNLAYYIVSGKLDKLYNSLQKLGLDEFSAMDLNGFLSFQLSRNPDMIDIFASHNTPEGFVEFQLQVINKDNNLKAQPYRLELTPHPVIEHGNYNGIGTEQLEHLMKAVRWIDNDAIYSFDENRSPELIYSPEITEIMRQMHELSAENKGAELVKQLQLKYYRSNDFLNELIDDEVLDYFKTLPKVQYEFAPTVEVKTAFNLLCGRPVSERFVYGTAGEPEKWVRLDMSKDKDLILFDGVQAETIDTLIASLPIKQNNLLSVRLELEQGDLAPVLLSNGKKILLEADPELQTINLYTQNMEVIPFNIGFDPLWIPPKIVDEISNQESIGSRQNTPKAKFPFLGKRSRHRKF